MNKILIALVAFLPAQAYAGFVVGPMAMSSGGPLGNAANSVFLYTYTGPDIVIGSGSFTGALLKIDEETLASEARWNIRNTRFPTSTGVNYQVTFTGFFTGTILIAADSGAGLVVQTGDVLRFETFESFDDSPGAEAVWSDAEFSFGDATITPLGSFDSGLDITTTGGPGPFGTDTEIGLYRSNGALVASNDDFGSTSGSGLINLTLTNGTYYFAVSPYNSFWANAVMGAGIDGIGPYDLQFNDATVDSATTVTRNMKWYSFTVPAACACPGDLNDDGSLDGRDIQGFVRCLTGAGTCDCADVDGVNGATIDDIDALITNLLTGAVCP